MVEVVYWVVGGGGGGATEVSVTGHTVVETTIVSVVR
jgi:hypothetical protein